jgi:hypothetical protein
MGFFPAQRPHPIFVVCLALSVMGTFTFAAADFSAFEVWKSESIIGGPAATVNTDYAINCLAECTAKTRGCSSLPSRKSTHIITLFGTPYAGIADSFSLAKSAQPIKAPNSKNTILLKLRI